MKSTLAPFACTTVRPGFDVMDADPTIQCNVPAGPHARMLAVGYFMVLAFGLGVPTAFGALLFVNRAAITADQRMRERGLGDTLITNPHVRLRHRYRKLYEDYRPRFTFWKVALLLRKLAFACVTVLLRHHVESQVVCGPLGTLGVMWLYGRCRVAAVQLMPASCLCLCDASGVGRCTIIAHDDH